MTDAVTDAQPRRSRARPPREPRLDRADWIRAARAALIEGGVDRVRIVPLAETIGVTTGSFYWHFADRPDLLAALLADWQHSNNRGFEAAMAADADPVVQFDRIVDIWVREDEFDPAYDSAMRDWARTAPDVADAVHGIDEARIALLRRIFTAMGDPEPEATVRARITYYHQVGYYAMRIRQPLAEREALRPVFSKLLRGGIGG